MPTISGTVRREGKPLGGAYVRLIGPSGEFTAEEYTAEDGAFLFHVVAGTWRIEARAANAATAVETVEISAGDAAVDVSVG